MRAPSPPSFVSLVFLSSTLPLSSSIGSLFDSPPLIGSSSILVSSAPLFVHLLLIIYQSHLIVVSVVRPRKVVERLEGGLWELLEGVLREFLKRMMRESLEMMGGTPFNAASTPPRA